MAGLSTSKRRVPAISSWLAALGIAAGLLCPAMASAQVTLGTAADFAVLGAAAVTNTGPSVVMGGNLGTSPGTSITGFPPGVVTGGFIDPSAAQAQTDLNTAYNFFLALPCTTPIAGDLGGQTLTPGVYCSAASIQNTGTLTLDYQGNPNAVFVFKIASTLITMPGSMVTAVNTGGNTCLANVNWLVGSSATLGTLSNFAGNILAVVSITLNTDVQLAGRALALNGAVTMDTNNITSCTVPPPVVVPVVTAVPTLSEWALVLLSSVTAMGAFVLTRRRKGGRA